MTIEIDDAPDPFPGVPLRVLPSTAQTAAPADEPDELAVGDWAGIVGTDFEGFIAAMLGDRLPVVVLRTVDGDFTVPAATVELRDEPGLPEAGAAARAVIEDWFTELEGVDLDGLGLALARAAVDAQRAASQGRPHA